MRKIWSSAACFLTIFLLGGLWYAGLMGGIYALHAPVIARPPEDQSMALLVIGDALLAALMSRLFWLRFKGRPTIAEGARFGAFFGVIATLPLYLLLYAIWIVPLQWIVIDSAWHAIQEAAGGIVLTLTMFPRRPRTRRVPGRIGGSQQAGSAGRRA